MSPPIRVAIVGGSICGCSLANGLLSLPHIAFDIFESKGSFTERGAEVSLPPNAHKALRGIGFDVDAAFKAAGAIAVSSTYCLVGQGEHRGKPLLQLPAGVQAVSRDEWLKQLLARLPAERLHANKKLLSLQHAPAGDGPITLSFEDGTTHEADLVIGCDGAWSKVRAAIFADQPALVPPTFGGYWDARGKLTPALAAAKFGTELFDPANPEEACLVGNGAFMLFVPTNAGASYHVVLSAVAGPSFDTSSWKTSLSREFLEDTYRDWDANFREGVIEALMADDSGPGVVFSQWESPATPKYYAGRACLMGDAAHSTTPWMGQGAAMATEDACVMAALLREAKSVSELGHVLEAFDATRRGRPEWVIEHSRRAAELLTGQMGLDPGKVAHLDAASWWTSVWDIDMDAHFKEALERFGKLRSG